MFTNNLRLLCTALGFLAVVMKDGNGTCDGADKAKKLAGFIEAFCHEALPEEFGEEAQLSPFSDRYIDEMIDEFKRQLVEKGEAHLPQHRGTLIHFYQQLMARQLLRRESNFFSLAPDDIIANRVLALVDEEINADEEDART